MKILYDGDSLEHTRGGVGRYFGYVMHGLEGPNQVTLLDSTARWDLTDRRINRIAMRQQSIARKIARKLGVTQRALSGYDISHTTFFRKTAAVSCPEVVTVHDMVTECFPELCRPWGSRQVDEKAAAIERADACIAISHETAKKMAVLYPESTAKTKVIYHGSEHVDDWLSATTKTTSSSPYVVYVGGRTGYKNFRTLAEATGSDKWPASVKLKVAGSSFSRDEELMLRLVGGRDRIENVGRLSDSSLANLYSASLGIVFPSLDEGFGLPIVEAQRLETIVLCSDIAVFHEIAGNAALYFNPREPESIAISVATLESLGSQRSNRVTLGTTNAARFSWETCVNETLELYESICN